MADGLTQRSSATLTTNDRHVLIVGASGVIGTGAVAHFAGLPGWRVTALSRRRPIVPDGIGFHHLSLDLDDAAASAEALAALLAVTHLIYAAASEAPGLVSGWYDDDRIAANGRMLSHVLDPLAATGSLRHVTLLQGTKAYGAHHHPIKIPAREDRPRDDHANFYWLHEDLVQARAAESGFGVTIFRPQVLTGTAPGVAMNPVLPIAAYAALCRELDRPFVYPGGEAVVCEMVDTGLLAEAFAWATTSSAAHGTFNITNGDVMVLAHAWFDLARDFGLATEGALSGSLAAFFAEPSVQTAWTRLAVRHGLHIIDLNAFLGESHHYLDLLIGERIGAKTVPVLLSTIKLRKAGFAGCRDSLDSLRDAIREMVALRLIPPFG